jgi:hypothetical protein
MTHVVLTVTNAAFVEATQTALCFTGKASSFGRTVTAHTIRASTTLMFAVLISNIIFDLVTPAARLESDLNHLAVRVTKAEHASGSKMLQVAISNLINVFRKSIDRRLFCVEKLIILHVVLFHEVKESVVGSQRTKLFDIYGYFLKFLLIAPKISIDRCQPYQDEFLVFSIKIRVLLNGI